MKLKQLTVKQSLNKAYRLLKPDRPDIEKFKANFKTLLSHINPAESEENMKGHVMDLLKNTWYKPTYHVATKGRTDFVIHTGKDATHPTGVLFEAKKPSNHEMVTPSNLNTKAMHELMLYYLRERIEHQNNDIKFLVITNIYEWFVFDAAEFERLFFKNIGFVKEYKAWMARQKVSANNDLFYNEIAKPFLASLTEEIEFTYFDIREYEKPLKDSDKNNDNKLITLFKVLSPTHLLKLPFANDNNTLDKGFYSELLYIIGLEEVKEGNKKLIRRRQEAKRLDGSLLENTIVQLETENCIHRVSDRQSYGETTSEQLFSVALELCITWVNRVLFLKLLEAQLIKYHRGNENYRFLNYKTISQYDELYKLFFQVLARKQWDRIEKVRVKYKHIPYLNSSLFDKTPLEEQTITINQLDPDAEMPLLNTTVLKDNKSKPVAQKLNTLQYLFDFLNAYDFASEGSEEIQEERKTLINASVLGLIFEKINGYKDGSIFTPGFITMYMCRQAIRQAVVNKFKEKYNWKVETFEDLHNYISDDRSAKTIKEYNALINSLTICDPAVGSGHFLVSALNELIAIKSELGILANANGKRLSEHTATVENDELLVTDKERNFFTYYVNDASDKITIPNAEIQRVQETLFHEKQTLIENSLFGVDINPKSVQICRLRLWIELLKNAYYIADGSNSNGELQTLPNIDINIKIGNSLVSRFDLDENLKAATPYFEKKILEYKSWVADYKHEVDKDKKRGIQQLMTDLKKGFLSKVTDRNPTKKKLDKLTGEFLSKYVNEKLFAQNLTVAQKNDKQRLEKEIEKLNRDLEAYIKSPVYNNAFEWRFEFPEVLNNEGNFEGFDVVIGNPPYVFGGKGVIGERIKEYFKDVFKTGSGKINLFTLFIELSYNILKQGGAFSFIIPNTFLRVTSYDASRRFYINNFQTFEIADFGTDVFEDAITTSIVLIAKKIKPDKYQEFLITKDYKVTNTLSPDQVEKADYVITINVSKNKDKILQKLKIGSVPLGELCKELIFGVVIANNRNDVVRTEPFENAKPFLEGDEIGSYYIAPVASYLNYNPQLLHRARTPAVFEVPEKLLIQRITGGNKPLKVAYDDKQFYNKESINNLILKDNCGYHIKFILALLNSKLINWFYTHSFTNESKLTVNLSKTYLSRIPIKQVEDKIQQPIVDLVNQILNKKQQNANTDISALEDEIDNLVYQLYKLTPEEVMVIEQSTAKKETAIV
jgi:adenine-specific DNA-methyltransferase